MNQYNNIKNAGWAVGTYCNANCRHCYSKRFREHNNPLTYREILCVLDKLKEFGIQTLNIGGNEPIYTDGSDISKSKLPFIIREAKKRNLELGITTNGITAQYLMNKHPDEFYIVDDWDISLDSPIPEEHNENRGVQLYDIAMSTLEHFQLRQVNCSIVMCLMNWNSTAAHAESLFKLAEKYKVELRINTLKPIIPEHFKVLPTINQIIYFFSTLSKYFVQINCTEPPVSFGVTGKTNSCPCGTASIAISGKKKDGSIPISPCVYLQELMTGDLLKDNITDLLQTESFIQISSREKSYPLQCKEINCNNINVCKGGCAARAYLIKHDINSADPLCPRLNQHDSSHIQLETDLKCSKNKSKVHENYLCTWIGRVRT